jgi:hypothetical protein
MGGKNAIIRRHRQGALLADSQLDRQNPHISTGDSRQGRHSRQDLLRLSCRAVTKAEEITRKTRVCLPTAGPGEPVGRRAPRAEGAWSGRPLRIPWFFYCIAWTSRT